MADFCKVAFEALFGPEEEDVHNDFYGEINVGDQQEVLCEGGGSCPGGFHFVNHLGEPVVIEETKGA